MKHFTYTRIYSNASSKKNDLSKAGTLQELKRVLPASIYGLAKVWPDADVFQLKIANNSANDLCVHILTSI